MKFLQRTFYILFSFSLVFSQELDYLTIASGFKKPLYLAPHVSDTKTLFVLEQRGIIWSLKNGIKAKKPFLDIKSKVHSPIFPGDERGLLGFAMSPKYDNDNSIYVNYINKYTSLI